MNDVLDVKKWIEWAQGDYNYALQKKAETNNPYAPVKACYECQLSAEKILKAYTIAKDGTRNKEHDLNILLNQCKRYSPDFDTLTVACSSLNVYVTAARYPSEINFTRSRMEQALQNAAQILDFTKAKLKEMGYEYTAEQM